MVFVGDGKEGGSKKRKSEAEEYWSLLISALMYTVPIILINIAFTHADLLKNFIKTQILDVKISTYMQWALATPCNSSLDDGFIPERTNRSDTAAQTWTC